MVGLGKLFRERRLLPANAPDTLNRYVIAVALPALVLVNVHALGLDRSLLWLVATPWLLLLASAAVVLVVARLAGWSRPVTGALLLLVPLGNTAFIGYPLADAMIGAEAVPYAVIYDQFGTFLVLSSFGLAIAAIFGDGAAPTPAVVAGRIVRFPPFLALLVALSPLPLPVSVLEVARMVAATLVPIACFAVGLQLRIRLPKALLAPFATGLVLKLIALPLGALLLLELAGTEDTLLRVGVLQSAMPSMITAGALAAAAGLEAELCAALVGIGMLLSFVTVPLMLALC